MMLDPAETPIMQKQPYLSLTFIGDDFKPGVLEAAKAAGTALVERGVVCKVLSLPNLCYVPHFGLGAMKNFAVMQALQDGCTHFMLLETDILLHDPEALWHMINTPKDIVVPFYDQTALPKPPAVLMCPQVEIEGDKLYPITWEYEQEDGMHKDIPPESKFENGCMLQLQWAVMSCMMFNVRVFRADCMGERPFTEVPIVKNEEYNCLWWRRRGAEIWQQLNARVTLLQPPTSSAGVTKQLYIKPSLGSVAYPKRVTDDAAK